MSGTLETIYSWDKQSWKQVDALLEREGISRDANLDYTCGSQERQVLPGSGVL